MYKKRRPGCRPPLAFPKRGLELDLNAFLDHEPDQVGDTAAITPLVVVPAHQFEKPLVQLDAGAGVEDGR
jgi:hypothetical protein